MMKGTLVDDNMSNLTSVSNNQTLQPTTKKKRNLPGNPDPEAEVIALSPRALLATNRFICEVCNKGFQRDQNLQLHRRGHNLPWKLKQRANKEVIRKKVYVCPEAGCVHHEASRALGDLTGIKKHFSRKHGEKKWKCDKCSKRYAVQSDWKAHSKICGTREYRCDCGTLFSRRDSFITHRAFCDALADESAKTTPISISSSQPPPNSTILSHFNFHTHPFQQFPLKTEQHEDHIPPWLGHLNPNPNPNSPFQHPPPHMSATALLQKAAQMGVKMSKDGPPEALFSRPHQVQPHHMCTTGLGLSSHEDMGNGGFVHGLSSFGDKGAVNVTSCCIDQVGATVETMMVSSLSSSTGYDHGSIATFEEAFNGVLNSRGGERNFEERLPPPPPPLAAVDQACLNRSKEGGGGGCSSGGNDGLTRDFLGLRGFPHRDFVSMGDLENMSSTSSYHHRNNQNQTPWQG